MIFLYFLLIIALLLPLLVLAIFIIAKLFIRSPKNIIETDFQIKSEEKSVKQSEELEYDELVKLHQQAYDKYVETMKNISPDEYFKKLSSLGFYIDQEMLKSYNALEIMKKTQEKGIASDIAALATMMHHLSIDSEWHNPHEIFLKLLKIDKVDFDKYGIVFSGGKVADAPDYIEIKEGDFYFLSFEAPIEGGRKRFAMSLDYDLDIKFIESINEMLLLWPDFFKGGGEKRQLINLFPTDESQFNYYVLAPLKGYEKAIDLNLKPSRIVGEHITGEW